MRSEEGIQSMPMYWNSWFLIFIKKAALVLVLLYFFSDAGAQNVFKRSNNGHHTQPAAGGGFYCVGGSLFDATLGKMDANGNAEWSKSYDFGGSNLFTYSMAATKDSGAVIVGTTYNGISFYPFLIKANKTGNVDFVKLYGTGGFYDVKQTLSGGFIACGINTGNSIVVNTDSKGNVIWSNSYSSSILYSVTQCKDSSFIASGLINDNIFVLKIGKDGAVQWAKEFDFVGQDNGQCVAEDKDGGFIISGQAGFITSPYQQSKGCILKVNKNGTLLWCKLLKDLSIGKDQQIGTANYISIDADNSYVLLNHTMVNFQSTNSLIKISSSLNILWGKDYGAGSSSNINFTGTVYSLPNNSYMISKWNAYSYKTDNMGNSGCANKPADFSLIDSLPAIKDAAISASSFNSVSNTTANKTTNAPAYPDVLETIDLLDIIPDGKTSFCYGENVTLRAKIKTSHESVAAFLWSNGENQSLITADQTARYTLRATSLSYCIRDTFIDITELPLPPANIAADGPTTFCSGDSVVLSAGDGNFAYQWWPGGSIKTKSFAAKSAGLYQVTVTNNLTGCKSTSSFAESVQVNVNPSPSATISKSGPVNFCNGDSVKLTAANAVSYLWSNGKTTAEITAKISGNYYLSLTGDNGCITKSDTVVVDAVAQAQPSIKITSENDTACTSASLKFKALAEFQGISPTYVWRINNVSQGNGFADSQFTLNDGDSVDCILTSSLGCLTVTKDTSNAIKVKVINKPDAPDLISGDNILCSGLKKTYNINPVNGADYYVWEVPDGSNIISGQGSIETLVGIGSTSGQIRVSSGNICGISNAQYKNITINNPPSNPLEITGQDSVCSNSIVKFYSVNFIQNADTYSWSIPDGATYRSGEGTSTIVIDYGSKSGNITVAAENSCGITSTITKAVTVIPPPEISGIISGLGNVCQSPNNLQYGISPVSGKVEYNWEVLGEGTLASGNGTPTVMVNFINDASLKVSISNKCGSSASLTKDVKIKVIPAMPQEITGVKNLCPNETKSYKVQKVDYASSYQWTFPQGAVALSGQGTDSVVVKAGSANGDITVMAINTCGSSNVKSIPITVNPLPQASGTINGLAEVCEKATNQLYNVSFSNADSYHWTVPAGMEIKGGMDTDAIQLNTGTLSGEIKVYAVNGCGESSIVSKTITVNSNPAKPIIVRNGSTLTSSDAFSFQWLMNGQIIQGANSISYISNAPGYYHVSITSNKGCKNKSDSVVIAEVINGTQATQALINNMKVYPNPVKDILTLEFPDEIETQVSIVNTSGSIMMEIASQKSKIVKLDVSYLPSGLYLMKVKTENHILTRQVIKL